MFRFVFTLIVLYSQVCIGQTLKLEGKIYRANSLEGLPYVTIAIKNSSKGTVSGLNGEFTLNALPTDSILFSSVGFQHKTIIASNISSSVFITEDVTELKEVIIQTNKRIKKAIIGNHKSKTKILFGGANQYCFLLKNEKGIDGVLEELYFNVEPNLDKNVRAETTVKIHLYENRNNTPGEDLLKENLIVTVKKNSKKLTVDVSNLSVAIPIDGIFIGIDLLGTTDEAGKFNPYNRNSTPLNLRVEFSDDNSFVTYSKFFGTEWSQVSFPNRNGTNTKVSAKFSAKVIY